MIGSVESPAQKRNERLAESAWASKEEDVKESLKHTMQFGIAALKGPVFINAAALAALLGFISANVKGGMIEGKEDVVISCLWIFATGLLISSISSAFAYITQYFYTEADKQYEKLWGHPYISERESWQRKWAIGFHGITALMVAGGYMSFFYGIYRFQELIKAVL